MALEDEIPQNYENRSFLFYLKTRRCMSVNWVACGTCCTKTEGTELGGIKLQRSVIFLKWGGGGRG